MRQADPEKAVRDFGRRVAEERAKQGWTQAEFAEMADFSVPYLQASRPVEKT
jgi:ribosome-binding protein aMBF1 (putative translation factor)